jgi:pRiA4b ORF-3-like protein
MIYTLTIDCVWGAYWREACRRVIEMRADAGLFDLHYAIQDAVRFDNDHPFEFYAARTERSRPRYPIGAEAFEQSVGGVPDDPMQEMLQCSGIRRGFRDEIIPPASQMEGLKWATRLAGMEDPGLDEIFPLPKPLKLYYWFDFGDDWKFEIKKARQEKEAEPRVKYPRVIERAGPNPVQYPNVE